MELCPWNENVTSSNPASNTFLQKSSEAKELPLVTVCIRSYQTSFAYRMYSANFGLILASHPEMITRFSYHSLNPSRICFFTSASSAKVPFCASESRQKIHLLLQAEAIRTQTRFCAWVFSFERRLVWFGILNYLKLSKVNLF